MLRAVGLSKVFPALDGRGSGLTLFRGLDLQVSAGEMLAILGRSGSGKSSLLHLLAGLERPSAGEVWIGSTAFGGLRAEELAAVRNRSIGFVWQFHYLLPEFSAAENVAMPLLARGVRRREAMAEASDWLGRVGLAGLAGLVGLADRGEHRPGELSGGEQQRVAIARALVARPAVLLADEPTGDLDDETAGELFDLLQELCRSEGLAAVLVTHNEEVAMRCDRRLRLVEGLLETV